MAYTKSEYRKLAAVAAAVMPIHRIPIGERTVSEEIMSQAMRSRAYRRMLRAIERGVNGELRG